MNVRYRVELSQAERGELTALLSGGKHAARKLKRAQILLAADAGAGDEDIAISVGVGGSTVYRTKRRFLVGNLDQQGFLFARELAGHARTRLFTQRLFLDGPVFDEMRRTADRARQTRQSRARAINQGKPSLA